MEAEDASGNWFQRLTKALQKQDYYRAFVCFINLIFLVISKLNLSALVLPSRRLIQESNGRILFSFEYRILFVLINGWLLVTSLWCLITTLVLQSNKLKVRLLQGSSLMQLILAVLLLLTLGQIWFAPPKFNLEERRLLREVERYKYYFGPDFNGIWPNGRTSSWLDAELEMNASRNERNPRDYSYRSELDQLQSALGCCGLRDPADWRRNKFAHLAPSCCLRPTLLAWPEVEPVSTLGRNSSSKSQLNLAGPSRARLFYCQWGTHWTSGCERLLRDREIRCLLHLRLQLLLLLVALLISGLGQHELASRVSSWIELELSLPNLAKPLNRMTQQRQTTRETPT